MNEDTRQDQSLSWEADAAFRQAAKKVIERAKQTGTPIIIWEDGKVKETCAEELEAAAQPAQLEATKP